jgi:hypothetical protein
MVIAGLLLARLARHGDLLNICGSFADGTS